MQDTNYKKIYEEDLKSKYWIGVIVDISDPLKQGRAKVRIFEKFDQRDFENSTGNYPDKSLTLKDYQDESLFILKNSQLPWIFPVSSTVFAGGENPGYGTFSTPKIGSLVRVRFVNNDIYSGEYFSLLKPNGSMLSKLSADEDYINASVTVFDEDEDYWMLYTKTTGLQIFHKGSQIVIRPDSSIFIEHKDSESMAEFLGPDIKVVSNRDIDVTSQNRVTINSQIVKINGEQTYIGESPIFSAVNGEPLMNLLKALAFIIDSKYAPTPGVASAAVDAASKMILSRSVKTSL
jgi:hypothetical protein